MSTVSRRTLLGAPAAGLAGGLMKAAVEKPALLGGKPVRTERFPSWPVFDQTEEQALLAALRSGNWNRRGGKNVEHFEESGVRKSAASTRAPPNEERGRSARPAGGASGRRRKTARRYAPNSWPRSARLSPMPCAWFQDPHGL